MQANLVEIRNENKKIEVKRRQVWIVDLGQTVGSVQGGKRPCVVCQNDLGNKYAPTTIILPLTSKIYKNDIPTHALIDEKFLDSLSVALGEQIRTIDKSQLLDYLGDVSEENMRQINVSIETANGLKKEFDYNKAYDMLRNYYNAKSLNKKYPNDNVVVEIYNNALKTYKTYCEDFMMDANEVNKKYREECLSQRLVQVK